MPTRINKAALKEIYPESFSGLLKFKDFEYYINIVDNARPVVHAPCKIALYLQSKLEKELEKIVRQGIFASVKNH